MKRLVICADGTWNAPESEGAKDNSSTNVLKMLRAILPKDQNDVEQIRYYCQGVGTGNAVDTLTGGMFGAGLSNHVLECYRFLANNYCVGDEIYIFGFSRGAFTARSLGGLIGALGLVTPSQLGKLPDGWAYYRLPPEKRATIEGQALLKYLDQRVTSVPIRCIGVWDTVGSLGVPGRFFNMYRASEFEFHDCKLGANVKVALHALAIDEQRKDFSPTEWDENAVRAGQTMEQVWFPGVHANVGGGYPDQGLSDVSLTWMIERVSTHTKLEFSKDFIETHVVPDPTSTLYDSRRGIIWNLRPKYVRPIKQGASIHQSVHKRCAAPLQPAYKPENLPA
ncbi:MAG: DUF2235 domain-containing protein [Rhodobacteraceae bacterium]|nr:DUF2235 domain-containing protein [Paracoccaceae bacterium]